MKSQSILLAVAALASACDEDVGGPCAYETTTVEARVIEIEPDTARWARCDGVQAFRLEMTDLETGEEVLHYGRYMGLVGAANELEQRGLGLGTVHLLDFMVSIEGSCSPEIFEFVDLDEDFELISCGSERDIE